MLINIKKNYKSSYVCFYYTDSKNKEMHIMKNYCNEFFYFNLFYKEWRKIKDLTQLEPDELFQEELINQYNLSVYCIKKLQEMNLSTDLFKEYNIDLEI